MRRIIGFSGRKRSGKSELAKALVSKHGATRLSVGKYLKELCYGLLNLSFEDAERMKDDGSTFEPVQASQWVGKLSKALHIDTDTLIQELWGVQLTDVRQTLQVIGTDLIRKHAPNWHVDQLVSEIMSLPEDALVVVDDVRFPNEREAVETLGGEVFFVMRPSVNTNISNHPSETSLLFTDFDTRHIIINDKSIELMTSSFLYKFTNGFDKSLTASCFLSDDERIVAEYRHILRSLKNNFNPLIAEQAKLIEDYDR